MLLLLSGRLNPRFTVVTQQVRAEGGGAGGEGKVFSRERFCLNGNICVSVVVDVCGRLERAVSCRAFCAPLLLPSVSPQRGAMTQREGARFDSPSGSCSACGCVLSGEIGVDTIYVAYRSLRGSGTTCVNTTYRFMSGHEMLPT